MSNYNIDNYSLLYTDWSNVCKISVVDSYTSLIRKIYEGTDKVASLKEIAITPEKLLYEKWICKSLL